MKKMLLFFFLMNGTIYAQSPSEEDRLVPAGSLLLAHYEGRTPCREISAELKLDASDACAKRKLSLFLYADSATRKPSYFYMRGVGARTGIGKWSVENGMAGNPKMTVYRLDFGDAALYLAKGGEQVLFVLDKNKNFLKGNEKYSYTLNRLMNKHSWEKWRELVHQGTSF